MRINTYAISEAKSAVIKSSHRKKKCDYKKSISNLAAMLSKVSISPDAILNPSVVPSLCHLAAQHVFPDLSSNNALWASNIIAISGFMEEMHLPEDVNNSLMKSMLEQLNVNDNPKLVSDITSTRVKNGESCADVARQHGISMRECSLALEMIAVKGPAGVRVKNGESCADVAQQHGILSRKAHLSLERMALAGLAGMRIKNGESCEYVAQQHGISHFEICIELEMLAVAGRVGARGKK